MNSEALTLMVIVQLSVVSVSAYFFWRVLTAPHRPEPDSYSENDDED